MTGKKEANDVSEYPYFGIRGPGSSVGIAIDYGLDGPGSNPYLQGLLQPMTLPP